MRVPTRVSRLGCCIAVGVLATLFSARPAFADAAPRWTDTQLVGFSDVIVRGRVAQLAVARDSEVGAIYTYVSVDVLEVLKGSVPEGRIAIKQLGGRIGTTALQIAGQPGFKIGEEVLLFLEVRPRDLTLAVTAQWQGKFSVRTGTGMAVRDDPAGISRGVFSDHSREVARWVGDLRRLIADSPAAARGPIDTALPDGVVPVSETAQDVDADAVWAGPVRVDTAAPGQAGLTDSGERALGQSAAFWSATGIASLRTGGLQPAGCFTAREPDGRITVGPDVCGELSPTGGTIALSGAWVEYGADGTDTARPHLVGAGVLVNRGAGATALLSQATCFAQLTAHELGHTVGVPDAPDGAGIMSSLLACDGGSGGTFVRLSRGSTGSSARPEFLPLHSVTKAPARQPDAARALDTVTCAVGCDITAADAVSGSTAPTNLTYTLVGSTLTLTWVAPTAGPPSAYVIEVGSLAGGTDIANFSTGSTATTFTAAVGGNAVFYIRVRATSSDGTSDPSNEVAVTVGTVTPVPDAPVGLTAVVANQSVTLTWSPPTSGGAVSSYIVQAGSATGLNDLANFSTGSSATTFSAAGVSPGTYFVRVRGSNAAGTGAASNEALVIIASGCTAPTAPSDFAAVVIGNAVTLTWTAGTGATGYELLVGSAPGLSDLQDLNLTSTSTTMTAVNVGPGTYFARLKSVNSCSSSAASNEVLVIVR